MNAHSTEDREDPAPILPLVDHPPSRNRGPLKGPPNYRSRRVQTRLFVLVSMFMLVLLAMDKARDPRMWEWLWAGEKWAQAPPVDSDQGDRGEFRPTPLGNLNAPKVNTKLPPPAPSGAPQPADSITTSLQPLWETPDEGSVADRIEDDLWARLLQSLDNDLQYALDRGLYLQRHGQPLDEDCLESWPALMERLQRRSSRYFADAKRATEHSTLTDEQLIAWLDVLQQRVVVWRQTLRALGQLGGVAAPPTPPWESREAHAARPRLDQLLQRVQRSLDRLAMANIKDNTVHRPSEGRAWYRMLEKLQSAPKTEATAETERVGFLQLFRQPDTYRGKLVTLHGTVQLAYQLQAPRNAFDIDGYTVLWVRPTTGPSSPVVVYSLGMPANFPKVVNRDEAGNASASTELEETVDITGYYFKNWAYRSREGINTAPLMLAREPQWRPAVNIAANRLEFSPQQLTIGITIVGAAAIVLAMLAFYSTKLPSRRTGEASETTLQNMSDLDLPSTSEQLQRMSEKDLE